MIAQFNAIGIYPKSGAIKQKLSNCAKCREIGKKNLRDPSLSINLNTGLYKCHKCGWKGKVGEPEALVQIVPYKPASKSNITKLSAKGLKMFTERGITPEVVKSNRIAMTKNGKGVVFPYLRRGKLVNYKVRFIEKKEFRQATGAEPIMYNYDRVCNSKNILITEGEFDALSWEVVGVDWHTSVNAGAPNENDQTADRKLECVTNCYEIFEQAEMVYLGVDNDANGRRLEEELIRRIGAEKIKLIDYSPCKDANELLQVHGAKELKARLNRAVEPKVEGIFRASDKWETMQDTFHKGKHRGSTTHIDQIDEAWTWRQGEITVWTGYENEGKSTFLQQLALIKAVFDGWKFAVFSPEDAPIEDFFDNLIEMFIGKSADPYFKSNQMSFEEYTLGYEFVNKHFFVIYPPKNYKLQTILDKAIYLIKRHGVRGMILDPYNSMEHLQNRSEREELYIARFMGELKRFSTDYFVSLHLVAHQNTQRKNKDTNRYNKPDKANIKGGGVFAHRADNVNIVWRPNMAIDFKSNEVVFESQKIKKQKLVGIPNLIENVAYSRKRNRYYFDGESPLEEVNRRREGANYVAPSKYETTPNILNNPTYGKADAVTNNIAPPTDDDMPF